MPHSHNPQTIISDVMTKDGNTVVLVARKTFALMGGTAVYDIEEVRWENNGASSRVNHPIKSFVNDEHMLRQRGPEFVLECEAFKVYMTGLGYGRDETLGPAKSLNGVHYETYVMGLRERAFKRANERATPGSPSYSK